VAHRRPGGLGGLVVGAEGEGMSRAPVINPRVVMRLERDDRRTRVQLPVATPLDDEPEDVQRYVLATTEHLTEQSND